MHAIRGIVSTRMVAKTYRGFYTLRGVINFFFLSFLVSRKIHGKRDQKNAVGPTVISPGIMLHEAVTLVHLVESSKPAARAQAVRLTAQLEVPES